MSRYDLEHIARQLEFSPTSKILRQIQDSPTSKIFRQIQISPTSRILRQIQDSPTSKILRQIQDSPTSKILRQIQDSPTSKILRQIQNSPTSKILRQIQDSPTSKILRQIQDSPTSKILREISNSQENKVTDQFRETSNFLSKSIFNDSYFQNLVDNTQKDFNNFWKKSGTQLYLEELINSHTDLVSITANISSTFIDDFNHKKESDVFSAEKVYLNDQNNESPNTIGSNNKILNFIFYSILLTIILNNISNYIYEFHVQPIAKEYHSPKSEKEVINHIKVNTYFDKSLLKSYRITNKPTNLYIESNLKSATSEQILPFTLVEKIEEPNLHKSWLKVRVEINDEIIEGYLLRSHTSPIK